MPDDTEMSTRDCPVFTYVAGVWCVCVGMWSDHLTAPPPRPGGWNIPEQWVEVVESPDSWGHRWSWYSVPSDNVRVQSAPCPTEIIFPWPPIGYRLGSLWAFRIQVNFAGAVGCNCKCRSIYQNKTISNRNGNLEINFEQFLASGGVLRLSFIK